MIKVFYETPDTYLWVDEYYVNSAGYTVLLRDYSRVKERENEGDKFDVLPKEFLE